MTASVGSVLSTYSGVHLMSGSATLNEPGWWRLRDNVPPFLTSGVLSLNLIIRSWCLRSVICVYIFLLLHGSENTLLHVLILILTRQLNLALLYCYHRNINASCVLISMTVTYCHIELCLVIDIDLE